MKKNKLISILIILTVFVANLNIFAAKAPEIEYNGKIIKSDALPFIKNNRTLVPIRFISETLGYKVNWNNETKEVTIENKNNNIKLKIDDDNASVNNKIVKLDVSPLIKDNRTFVPIRFVAENLNAEIKWDSENFKVIIKDSSNSLGLENDEENYVNEITKLQKELSISMGNLKSSFFENASKLSEKELNLAYEKAESEINNIISKIKGLEVPEKFKTAHAYSIKASERALEILPNFKEAIISKNEDAAKSFVQELTDFQILLKEAKDSFESALKGKDYKADKDIKVYNDEKKKQDSTENLLQDETLKNIFKKI